MGSSFSAIEDDQDEYKRLLKEFNQPRLPENKGGGTYKAQWYWLRKKAHKETTQTWEEFYKDWQIKELTEQIEKKKIEVEKSLAELGKLEQQLQWNQTHFEGK